MRTLAGHQLTLDDNWGPWRCTRCHALYMFRVDALEQPCPCPPPAPSARTDRSGWPWIAGAFLAAIAAERGCPLWMIPLAVMFPPAAVALLMATTDRED